MGIIRPNRSRLHDWMNADNTSSIDNLFRILIAVVLFVPPAWAHLDVSIRSRIAAFECLYLADLSGSIPPHTPESRDCSPMARWLPLHMHRLATGRPSGQSHRHSPGCRHHREPTIINDCRCNRCDHKLNARRRHKQQQCKRNKFTKPCEIPQRRRGRAQSACTHISGGGAP